MRRRRPGCNNNLFALLAIAFGVGLVIAMFCSFKVVVFMVAIALILFGLCVV